MKRKQILADICVASIGIIFILVMLWFRPDKALIMLVPASIPIIIALFIGRKTRIDERKDERTMQLMILGARNALFSLQCQCSRLSVLLELS